MAVSFNLFAVARFFNDLPRVRGTFSLNWPLVRMTYIYVMPELPQVRDKFSSSCLRDEWRIYTHLYGKVLVPRGRKTYMSCAFSIFVIFVGYHKVVFYPMIICHPSRGMIFVFGIANLKILALGTNDVYIRHMLPVFFAFSRAHGQFVCFTSRPQGKTRITSIRHSSLRHGFLEMPRPGHNMFFAYNDVYIHHSYPSDQNFLGSWRIYTSSAAKGLIYLVPWCNLHTRMSNMKW